MAYNSPALAHREHRLWRFWDEKVYFIARSARIGAFRLSRRGRNGAFLANYRFAAHYREGYEGGGVYPLSRSPDHKVPYAKWVISYEHRGDGQSLGRLGNLATHPGVNASDLFAHSALIPGARGRPPSRTSPSKPPG